MKITNDRKLADLQKDFEKLFPFLQIQFYDTAYQRGRSCNESHLLDPKFLLGNLRSNTNAGYFTIDEEMSVGTFEQLLWDLYGLHVQVFRKSYGKWLQTWATDNWSLKDQNHRSRIMGDKGPKQLKKATPAA